MKGTSMKTTFMAFVQLLPFLAFGQIDLFGGRRTEFVSALSLPLEMVSTNTATIDWQSIGVGSSWISNAWSNHVVAVESTTLERPNVKHTLEIVSRNIETTNCVHIFIEEFQDSVSAYRQFVSDFVENTLPMDMVVQQLELRDTVGDLCLVSFPSIDSHEEATACSLRAVAGKNLFISSGHGETNLISATKSIPILWGN